jgi:hypothetical protein
MTIPLSSKMNNFLICLITPILNWQFYGQWIKLSWLKIFDIFNLQKKSWTLRRKEKWVIFQALIFHSVPKAAKKIESAYYRRFLKHLGIKWYQDCLNWLCLSQDIAVWNPIIFLHMLKIIDFYWKKGKNDLAEIRTNDQFRPNSCLNQYDTLL